MDTEWLLLREARESRILTSWFGRKKYTQAYRKTKHSSAPACIHVRSRTKQTHCFSLNKNCPLFALCSVFFVGVGVGFSAAGFSLLNDCWSREMLLEMLPGHKLSWGGVKAKQPNVCVESRSSKFSSKIKKMSLQRLGFISFKKGNALTFVAELSSKIREADASLSVIVTTISSRFYSTSRSIQLAPSPNNSCFRKWQCSVFMFFRE